MDNTKLQTTNSLIQEIRCPQCLGVLSYKPAANDLKNSDGVYICSSCNKEFPVILNVPFFGIRKDNTSATMAEIEAEDFWFTEESSIEEHLSFAKLSAQVGWSMIKELSRFLPNKPKILNVLDLGSGSGMQAWQLATYGRFTVAAVDCVGEFLVEAPEIIQSHPKIKMFCSDLAIVPFKDNSFDVIFCKESLHHISDLRATFGEIVRVAKPGALLVIKEPLWPCKTPEEREKFKFTDRAAKVGIAHAYHCFNDYSQLVETTSETLLLRLSPAKDWLSRQLLWFATDSHRLPQIAKPIFRLLFNIYERFRKVTANKGRMNKWGGEFFEIARIKDESNSSNLHSDRTIVPIDVNAMKAEKRASIRIYNEKIFEVFDRETKALIKGQ
jgi:ubiquinone/menaquinone biosynthesis C-methylase UbiE/uncharacterized protein YbaR (Trm112 family)